MGLHTRAAFLSLSTGGVPAVDGAPNKEQTVHRVIGQGLVPKRVWVKLSFRNVLKHAPLADGRRQLLLVRCAGTTARLDDGTVNASVEHGGR